MSIEIDMSRLVSGDAKAAAAQVERKRQIKDACAARIASCLDANTMANIQSAALVGALTAEQLEDFRHAQQWVAATLRAARSAIAEGCEPEWPEQPEGLDALAAQF